MKTRLAFIASMLLVLVGIPSWATPPAYAALALTTTAPTINDTTPQVGQTLTVTPSSTANAGWGPAPITYAYQWYRCSVVSPYTCSTVGGSSSVNTHVVTAAEKGFQLKVRVTGSKSGYATAARYSALTSATLGTLTTSTPTVNDTTPQVGQTLTVIPNSAVSTGWAPAPIAFTYQWYKCGATAPYTCVGVGTATTSKTHIVSSGERGYRLKVKVTAKKAGYATVSKTSAQTSVTLGTLTTTTPTVNDTTPQVDQTLTVVPNTSSYAGWAPAPITFTYQWYKCNNLSPTVCTTVGAATTSRYHKVTAAEKGYRLKAKVMGSKSGYVTATKYTALTSAVAQSALRAAIQKGFGTFTPITKSGTGSDVVYLPAGVKAGVVTATHAGESNFIIWSLNASNEESDLVVNEIGPYSGQGAFGLDLYETPTKLSIEADGAWTVRIAPVDQAPILSLPTSAVGSKVYLFDGAAADWRLTHQGESNFIVEQWWPADWDLLVNEIGNYQGTVPAKAGPGVLTVMADGAWTVARA